MGHERDGENQQSADDRNNRPHSKESKPGADGDKLRDQSQEISDHQVDHRKPAPERAETVEDQFRVAAMRGRA